MIGSKSQDAYFKSHLNAIYIKHILDSSPVTFLILVSVLLELPVPVVQGADLPGLQPPGDAVEVEGMVTHPPGHSALLAGGAGLDRLCIKCMMVTI